MIKHEYIHEGRFEFEAGGSIENLHVAYHTSEKPWEEDDERKVIWICHALTANSDPEEWWPELVGPGKLFDTEKYFVVCANMLGSPYGSSGPSSINPVTGQPYYFDFPLITVRDIVKANDLVRRHLGIKQIDLMIGGSIGGFQSLEWAVMEPDVIKRVVGIACAVKCSAWLAAYNESMRMAMEADPTFRRCESLKGGEAGLRCARSIALISYRSYQGYNLKQSEQDEDFMFASRCASYQRYQGKKLSDRFDAYSYNSMVYITDSHNVGRNRNGVTAALNSVKANTICVGIDSDGLFPCCEQKFMAEHIPGAKYREITSLFGHDGFLLEWEQITKIFKEVID